MATLTIHRQATPLVDRARAYKVEVDGETVGTVRHGETITTDLSPGSHRVRIAIDWCGSATLDVDGGTDTVLTCRANAQPYSAIIYALFLRNHYIGLTRSA